MILSASRRTDIPALYSEWFVNRLYAGYVLKRNPINPSQVTRIELTPENIDCIVFWTKDPENMIRFLPQIDSMGYPYYFLFTLTPYDRSIERNIRDKSSIADTFIRLSDQIGKDKVQWRYDPILLSDSINIEYHIKEFENLCIKLHSHTDSCTISFVDYYAKLAKAIQRGLFRILADNEIRLLAATLSDIARFYGLKIKACCESNDLSRFGIIPASCIDHDLVEKLCGYPISYKHDSNQRNGCGCIQSTDIGSYNTCINDCVYCYANSSTKIIQRRHSTHDPMSDIL